MRLYRRSKVTAPTMDKHARRRSTAAAKPAPSALQSMRGLRQDQVAFLGECRTSSGEKHIDVQALCWPAVSTAWLTLTQSLAGLPSLRGDDRAFTHRVPALSWLRDVAPQLCPPVERESSAIESTLATIIRRLPLRFAVAVVEYQAGQRPRSDAMRYRSLFSSCLTTYATNLKSTNQTACRIIVASPGNATDNDLRRTAYGEVLPHLDSAARLGALELDFWPEATLPLPLEVAQLAAAAVGRHLERPAEASLVFEAVRAHLAPPSRFHALSRQTRRK